MESRPVVFRTLDIGGDKMLSYFPRINESNPFLGLRAIRFSLRNRDIFDQQLRALLRAGAGGNLKIMFPLISSVDDFIQARDM
jgi:phosphoenolpyruvate-protein kinase (PTS system EI component)